jgi:hypothetical protein
VTVDGNNYVEELYWAQEEVLRFLKFRSKSISIHYTDELEKLAANYKVIFEDEE